MIEIAHNLPNDCAAFDVSLNLPAVSFVSMRNVLATDLILVGILGVINKQHQIPVTTLLYINRLVQDSRNQPHFK